MDNSILQMVQHYQQWFYAIMFCAMFFDANLMILIAAFLISSKILNPYILSAIVIFGAYLEQLLWYSVGKWLGKNDFISRWATKLVGRYDRHMSGRIFHSLVLSKFVYGTHKAALTRIGMLGITLKNFAKASLKATAVWLIIVGSIGFGFSESYKVLNKYISYGAIILLGFLVLIFGAQYFISKKLQKDL